MIAYGHNPRDVWDYTPRQAAAFLFIAGQRRRREMAERLNIATLAARGDEKDIRKFINGADE